MIFHILYILYIQFLHYIFILLYIIYNFFNLFICSYTRILTLVISYLFIRSGSKKFKPSCTAKNLSIISVFAVLHIALKITRTKCNVILTLYNTSLKDHHALLFRLLKKFNSHPVETLN